MGTARLFQAKALNTSEKLGCWLAKQTNRTSKALSGLLLDVYSVRLATLQSRAAIDLLLLAQGHGCEEFDGLCCLDFEDHSQSIHKRIQQLMDHSQKIKEDVGLFGLEGLTNWFGIGGWLKSLLQSILLILIIVVIGSMCVNCILSCIRKGLEKAVNQAWVVQKEKKKGNC